MLAAQQWKAEDEEELKNLTAPPISGAAGFDNWEGGILAGAGRVDAGFRARVVAHVDANPANWPNPANYTAAEVRQFGRLDQSTRANVVPNSDAATKIAASSPDGFGELYRLFDKAWGTGTEQQQHKRNIKLLQNPYDGKTKFETWLDSIEKVTRRCPVIYAPPLHPHRIRLMKNTLQEKTCGVDFSVAFLEIANLGAAPTWDRVKAKMMERWEDAGGGEKSEKDIAIFSALARMEEIAAASNNPQRRTTSAEQPAASNNPPPPPAESGGSTNSGTPDISILQALVADFKKGAKALKGVKGGMQSMAQQQQQQQQQQQPTMQQPMLQQSTFPQQVQNAGFQQPQMGMGPQHPQAMGFHNPQMGYGQQQNYGPVQPPYLPPAGPMPPATPYNGKAKGKGKGGKTCHNCGGKGHFKVDCPSPDQALVG